MAFSRTIWVPGAPPELTADQLNRIEQGIVDANANPGASYDTAPIGEVKAWSRTAIPDGYVLANGQALVRDLYPDAWTAAQAEIAAGNPLWTAGNGTTTFTVPNLTDKFIYGKGANALGATGGAATVRLTAAQSGLPSHTHPVGDTGGFSTAVTNENNAAGGVGHYTRGSGGDILRADAVTPADATADHQNLPPYVVMAWIVKIKGVTVSGDALVGPTGPVGSGAQEAPHIVGVAGEPAFNAAFTSWDGGVAFQPPAFWIDALGVVHLAGLAKTVSTPTADLTPLFVLPVGYRPSKRLLFDVGTQNGAGRIDVLPDGTVQYESGLTGANQWVALEAISFGTGKLSVLAGPIGPAGPDSSAVVTSLPAPPTDGQMVLWRTTVTGLGSVTRRMRYDAGLGKWEQLGRGGKFRALMVERLNHASVNANGEAFTAWRTRLPAAAGDLIECKLTVYTDNAANNNLNAAFGTMSDANAFVNLFPWASGETFHSGIYLNAGAQAQIHTMHGLLRLVTGDIRSDGSVQVNVNWGAAATISNIGANELATTLELFNHGQADA
jgi:microcystin-dependent protein